MKTYMECIPCFISQALKTGDIMDLDKKTKQEILQKVLLKLSDIDYDNSPPVIAKEVYSIINSYSKTGDPYYDIKRYYNNKLAKIKDDIKQRVKNSDKPFDELIKLVILGNIIDFGAVEDINRDFILKEINSIESKILSEDNSEALYKELLGAKSLLYLGDNCGELVFDSIFIEYIKNNFPDIDIYFAVRGKPIINDVLLEDAKELGIDSYAKIIENGDSAPGTVLESCSKDFRDIFRNSDIIISKGQGNYESLCTNSKESIYFLFMAKCKAVANRLDVDQMSLLCKKNQG